MTDLSSGSSAYFVSMGIYIKHVVSKDLPKYKGIAYKEEKNKNKYSKDQQWDIKSIRDMVFHDPVDENPPPAIMILIEWDMGKNIGTWVEEPNKQSVFTWETFYSLNDYYAFSQYLRHRSRKISGITVNLGCFEHMSRETDRETYEKRYKMKKQQEKK